MSKNSGSTTHINGKILVQKTIPSAEFPFRERVESPIYNLTLVNRTDNREEDEIGHFNDFGLGLKVCPPPNHFIEIIASPSLHKHGYVLYHPVIIDANYQGEVKVPLYKLEDSEDLQLPFDGLRMIVRQSIYAHVYNVVPQRQKTYDEYTTEVSSVPAPRQMATATRSNHMF